MDNDNGIEQRYEVHNNMPTTVISLIHQGVCTNVL